MSPLNDAPLPELADLGDRAALAHALSLLLEPTPTLLNLLVPQILDRVSAQDAPLQSYNQLIDLAEDAASEWSWEDKANFVHGHPKIGAPAAKISVLSGKEQSAGPVTPQVVLDRLKHLNEVYSVMYPGLIYITFVNGRSRGEIVTEMEERLGLPVSPTPLPDNATIDQPAIESEEIQQKIHSQDSEAWRKECNRAIGDVWLIARSRLKGLGQE